jgi:hypothetical protein
LENIELSTDTMITIGYGNNVRLWLVNGPGSRSNKNMIDPYPSAFGALPTTEYVGVGAYYADWLGLITAGGIPIKKT